MCLVSESYGVLLAVVDLMENVPIRLVYTSCITGHRASFQVGLGCYGSSVCSYTLSSKQALFEADTITITAHTHPFNGPFSRTTRVGRYQKGKTNLDFTEARDREWQWHQLGHMQVCTSLQADNHASTSPLSFLQAGCPSCHPTNSVKALKALCAASQHTMQKINAG